MDNTKIGNKEAIALLTTISFNQLIVGGAKFIISRCSSASLLNLLYISLIAIVVAGIMCYFLNNFPSYDLIDISNFLGGKYFKWIICIIYIAYFFLWTGNLLHMFSTSLQIIYFSQTSLFFIKLFILMSVIITCLFKNNAVYRSTFIIFPLILISTLFLFVSDIKFFYIENIYPMLGNGFFSTFFGGLSNLLIFQVLTYFFFFPTLLKNPFEIRKVTIYSIIISSILNILCVATVLFTSNTFFEVNELIPLYAAVKLIDYGAFFQKMDSIFFLIWIICFIAYLSITIKVSSNILKRLFYSNSDSFFVILCSILLLIASCWQKSYAMSICFIEHFLKYAFFILVFVVPTLILIFATLKQKIARWIK